MPTNNVSDIEQKEQRAKTGKDIEEALSRLRLNLRRRQCGRMPQFGLSDEARRFVIRY